MLRLLFWSYSVILLPEWEQVRQNFINFSWSVGEWGIQGPSRNKYLDFGVATDFGITTEESSKMMPSSRMNKLWKIQRRLMLYEIEGPVLLQIPNGINMSIKKWMYKLWRGILILIVKVVSKNVVPCISLFVPITFAKRIKDLQCLFRNQQIDGSYSRYCLPISLSSRICCFIKNWM